MTQELLIALVAFCFVATITPGPNNLMLMASGANFGLQRTLPHMFGVTLGFAFMVTLVGLGLSRVFEAFPVVHDLLRVASVAYLLWLAWKIANAAPPESMEGDRRPLSFLQAAAFQWVNPKAWSTALTVVTVYSPGHALSAALVTAAIFTLVTLPCTGCWVLLGREMARLLTNRARLRLFNGTMAALLVASLYPALA